MKIKDIISELQRYSPDDYCAIEQRGDGHNNHQDFDIVPSRGTRHSVALQIEPCSHSEDMADLESENDSLKKNLDRAGELAKTLETSIHEEDPTDTIAAVKELLEVTDEN